MGCKVELLKARCISALRDANHASWPEEVIHDAIYEAEKVIAQFKPESSAADVVFDCVAGTRQSLAALDSPPASRLLDVMHNVASDGTTAGRSVRRTSIGDRDARTPMWRSATPADEVKEFLIDDRMPLLFEVNPPVTEGTKIRIAYSAIPTPYGDEIDEDTETTVSALYEPQLVEWALYRLFGNDTEGSVNIAKSDRALANFQNMMGIHINAEKMASSKNLEHKR